MFLDFQGNIKKWILGALRTISFSPSFFLNIGANIGTFSIMPKLLNLRNIIWSSLLRPYWKMSFKIRSSCTRTRLLLVCETKTNLGNNQINYYEATDLRHNCVLLKRHQKWYLPVFPGRFFQEFWLLYYQRS